MTKASSIEGRRAFFQVHEAHSRQLDLSMEKLIAELPGFGPFFSQLTEAEKALMREQRSAQLSAALLDDDWEALVTDLKAKGAAYARGGIEFSQWYQLLDVFRSEMLTFLFEDLDGDQRLLQSALMEMGRYIDTSMSIISEAYLQEKQSKLLGAQGELTLFQRMFENASLGMTIYRWRDQPDPGGLEMVAFNKANSTITGVDMTPLLGQTLRERDSKLLETDIPARMARCAETGEADGWEITYGDEIFSEIRYEVNCFFLKKDHIGIVFEDVTERHRQKMLLEGYVSELTRSNQSLDDFAYVASHDLKAPLRDIDNLASWVTEDINDLIPEGSQRHLKLLRERIRRMEHLLGDLLEYSRVGRIDSEPETIMLGDLLESEIELLAPTSQISVSVEGDMPELHCPRAPLAQVIRNLVNNAIKHHDKSEGAVTITSRVEGDRLAVVVADDGPGIAKDCHERIFRMFQTLRSRDQVEGSGMGLALVKKMVEYYGGTIAVESEVGQGSAFRFDWPLHWAGPPPEMVMIRNRGRTRS